MEEGARQRRISKRKRSEPRDNEVGDVVERVTDLLLNGDAGKTIENQVQPNTKRFRGSKNNIILPKGNGPPSNFFLPRNEPGSRTPQLTPRGTGEGTTAPRQSQGQLTPPLRDPATHRPYTGARGTSNDAPRQYTPDMGVTGNEVRLKRQAFESLFKKKT